MLELPVFTLTEYVYKFLEGDQDCSNWWNANIGLPLDQAEDLCTKSEHFTMEEPFHTLQAFFFAYFYGEEYNPKYYREFVKITGSEAYTARNAELISKVNRFIDINQYQLKNSYQHQLACDGPELKNV